MRTLIAAAALLGAAIAGTAVAVAPRPAHAQTLDRYGGAVAPTTYPAQAAAPLYAQPAYAQPTAQPSPYGSAPAYGYPSMQATYAAPARRDGGDRQANAYRQPPMPAASAAGLRTLSWPGKDSAQPIPVSQPMPGPMRSAPAYTPPTAYAPQAGYGARYEPRYPTQAAPAYAPMGSAASLPTSGGVQPAPTAFRAVPVQTPGPAPAQVPAPLPAQTYAFAPPPSATARPAGPLPTSIYSDAPPRAGYTPTSGYAAPPQPRVVQAQATAADLTPEQRAAQLGPPNPSGGSRLYSVHRDYGLTPDPAPIPPQFFAATADLTAPETPDAPVRATSTTASGSTAARAAQNSARLAAASTQ